MLRQFLFVALGVSILTGCSTPEKTAQTSPIVEQPLVQKAVSVGDYELQPPIYAGSVAIVPVTYNKNLPQQQEGNYITLAEAKKAGLVVITELGDETVETLLVENKSDRPLLLIGGDLLLGGKQDRIVAHDVIVPPGKTMKVDVYCVENGRWDGKSEHFEYKETVVPERVRQAAAHKGQQEVWAEVDGYNEASGFGSGSLTVAAGMESEKVKKTLSDHLPRVVDSLKDKKNVVGFVYVLNGKIQAADLFGSPGILSAARNSVLKGYLADGANEAPDPKATADLGDCRRFLEEILKDRKQRSESVKNTGRSATFETRFARGVELNIAEGKSAEESPGLVHGNYSIRR
jgi:hypothetical protein